MAELSLFPALRAAGPDDLVVADGTSCRHQIQDGLGLEAQHVARVLDDALVHAPPLDTELSCTYTCRTGCFDLACTVGS